MALPCTVFMYHLAYLPHQTCSELGSKPAWYARLCVLVVLSVARSLVEPRPSRLLLCCECGVTIHALWLSGASHASPACVYGIWYTEVSQCKASVRMPVLLGP